MRDFRKTAKSAAAALLVFCVLAAVYGCNKNISVDEGLETLVLTDANGQTKVSYRVVVTATDESGEEYVVTEYYVDDKDEAIEANSRAATTTTVKATEATGTTKAAVTTKSTQGILDPTTPSTTKSGSGTTAKTTTKAAATTMSTTGKTTTGSSTSTTKTVTTTKVTTTKVTTTKVTTTKETTTYVPVSEISAAFTYLNTTDQASYFASSSTLSDFGLPADKQTSLKNNPSSWDTYTIAVDFKNTTGSNVTIYGLKLTENGKSGVYVAPNSAGVSGYTAGDKASQRIYFNVLVNNGSLSESAVIATIKSMDASLVYSRTPGNDNDAVQKQYSSIK